MALEVHPLHVGTLYDYPTAGITFQRGYGDTMSVAMIMFAILGGPKPIVVDTGTGDEHLTKAEHGFNLRRPPEQEPLAALRRIGVDPASVETVIHTHLHWDHSSNNHLFPNARFYVQRSELAYAIAPLETNRVAFHNTREVSPSWLPQLKRIVPLDGDQRIVDGVSVVHLPGHTPGSQGVLVDVSDRQVMLAGDFVDTYKNWEGDERVPHIPAGSFTDLHKYWESYRKVENLGCEVVPSHDLAVIERGVIR